MEASASSTLRPIDFEKEFKIKRQTQANWRSTGRGPDWIRVSPRLVLYERKAIEDWLASQRVSPSR